MERGESETRLAVILLNWNHSTETLDTLSRLRSWNNLNPQIIVVDNASSEHERDILLNQAKEENIVLNSENRGFAGGNNDGIRKVLEEGCAYTLLLNVDAEVTEDVIVSLRSILGNHPDIGVIGPLIQEGERIFAGGRDIGMYSNTRIPYLSEKMDAEVISVDYVPGMVFLARSDVFQKIGLLSEDFFFSGEIADLCRRCRDEGFSCAVHTKSTAIHHVEVGKLRNLIYPYYTLRNRFLYIRRHARYMRAMLFARWWASGVFYGTIAYVRGNRGLACALYLAVKDGIQGTYGNQHERIRAECHHCHSELEWNALA